MHAFVVLSACAPIHTLMGYRQCARHACQRAVDARACARRALAPQRHTAVAFAPSCAWRRSVEIDEQAVNAIWSKAECESLGRVVS